MRAWDNFTSKLIWISSIKVARMFKAKEFEEVTPVIKEMFAELDADGSRRVALSSVLVPPGRKCWPSADLPNCTLTCFLKG